MYRARLRTGQRHHTPSTTSRDHTEAGQLHVPTCCCTAPYLVCICHAFFCLCLDSICHTCPCLHLPCHITQPYHVCQDHLCGSVCKDCPAGSRIIGDCFCAARLFVVDKGQFKWTVRQRVACRVRVSCLQQPGKQKTNKQNKQRTIEGPEDA